MESLEAAIVKLWKEAHNVKYIAMKLGLYDEVGELDTEMVEMVIDNHNNFIFRILFMTIFGLAVIAVLIVTLV